MDKGYKDKLDEAIDNANDALGMFGKHISDKTWRMRLGQRGWLRPTVLRVLEEKPMNGIEIMNKIQDMSHGWWRPSPGSLYPLLEQLAQEEILNKRDDGKYELAKAYRMRHEAVNEIDDVLQNMESNVTYLEELMQSSKGKLTPYKTRIEKINKRISRIK